MSQQPPNDFVPPAPPQTGNPLYPPDVLASQAASVASDVKTALILSIVGLFCFGFILGFFAFLKADEALDTINHYQVAQDKRSMAMTAKVLAIVDIVGWVLALLANFLL